MFGTNTKSKKPIFSTESPANGHEKDGVVTTVIAKGTVIEGTFACAENARLDGTIHGEVKVEKRFVMGDTSYVQGNINAHNAAVNGKIAGDITVQEMLHLMNTANVEGSIAAQTMVVEEGARHNGACRIG